MRTLPLLVVVLFAGCDRFDESGVFVSPPCEDQAVEQLHPANGAEDVWVGGLIWVDLVCPAPGATMSLNGPAGAVAGSTFIQHGGHQILFEPAAWLQADANYVARLDTADAYREVAFATGSLGQPLQAALNERALALHPAQGALLDPAGFLADLPPALQAGLHPVVQFLGDPSGATLPLRLGGRLDSRATAGQDLDDTTWDLSARWEDPIWTVGPLDMTWQLFDFPLVLEGAVLQGVLATDAGSGGGGSLDALWDTRPAEDVLGTGAGSLCGRNGAAGGDGCVPCADGRVSCLPFALRSIPAEAWGGVLQVVDPD
mgnify:CR=1 FL=1